MASLKEQALSRGLLGKCRRLENENEELKALVKTLQTWNESLKNRLRENFTIHASAASVDDVD